MKNVVVLGSTGSIGESTLEVIRQARNNFRVVGLSAHSQEHRLEAQAKEFKAPFKVLSRHDQDQTQLMELVTKDEVDLVVVAIVGFAALRPTLAAIEAGKTVALANKEALVTCGEILIEKSKTCGSQIIPIDSEHNALFQVLQGHSTKNVEKLWITGSGGPFRGKRADELRHVDVPSALNHPKWKMGPKITVDSASLMNKGLEFIEARWIFDLDPKKIEVLIHPQSIVHGIVEFVDGAQLAHMSVPDMKGAIAYALNFPDRQPGVIKKLNLGEIKTLEFEPVDNQTFPSINLAKMALERGGVAPLVLNAANEVAVDAFLKERIRFLDIPELVSKTLDAAPQQHISLEDVFAVDKWARLKAHEKISSLTR